MNIRARLRTLERLIGDSCPACKERKHIILLDPDADPPDSEPCPCCGRWPRVRGKFISLNVGPAPVRSEPGIVNLSSTEKRPEAGAVGTPEN